MNTKILNVMLAQFLFLSLACGLTLGAVIFGIFESLGFVGRYAEIAAGLLGLVLVAIAVVARWKLRRQLPIVNPNLLSRNNWGHALVAIGNAVMLFGVVVPLIVTSASRTDPVVGGIIVLLGGGIAMIAWFLGLLLTKSSEEK
jgi:hypothetical protein